MTVEAAELAKLPFAVALDGIAVGKVSAIYMDCTGVQPNEKMIPKLKMDATMY